MNKDRQMMPKKRSEKANFSFSAQVKMERVIHIQFALRLHIQTNPQYQCDLFLMSKIQKYKRPMGHIAHLRKQFQLINTYDYIITLIKRRKKVKNHYSLYDNILFLLLNKLESKEALCQVWLKLAQWFWRRR